MIKKFLLPLIALLAFAETAQADCTSLIGVYNADNVPFVAGQAQTCPVAAAALFKPMGVISSIAAPFATAGGTTEQTAATYSLPANAFDVVGRHIRIRTTWHAATNGNNKTVKLYFGSEIISSGTLTTSNKNGFLELDAWRSASKVQQTWGIGYVDTTNITPAYTAGAEDDTAAIVIKVTAQDGTDSAGDITINDFTVEYMN